MNTVPDTQPFQTMLMTSLGDMPKHNYPLDLRLFAKVNNDAWLNNSTLEGGQAAETASLLSAIIKDMQAPESCAALQVQPLKTIQEMLFQILENTWEIQRVTEEGKRQTLESKSREPLIQDIAHKFANKIKSLQSGDSFLTSGGYHGHAMLFEFKRIDDQLVLMVYNTGGGLKYHDSMTVNDHGVVKTKKFPVKAYRLPFNNASSPEFTNYLTEILKADIASEWTPIASEENNPLAYRRDANHLYQEILPLIVHLNGELINPQSVCKQEKFITGQRSGKCSEAVFHPLLREAFADETTYQRFMLAYRKATIASFLKEANLNDPMVVRQLHLAVTNLAARAYKHSPTLSSDELKAITAFTQEVLSKLPVPTLETDATLEEPTLSPLALSKFELGKGLEPKQPLTSINLAATDAIPTSTQDTLQPCDVDVTAATTLVELFESMNKLQNWITQASTRPEISPKEIVVAIEQFFFTYPMHLLNQPCNEEQRKTLATFIQTFMTFYLKYYLQQFSADASNPAPSCLTARHVVTVYSALALMTTSDDNDTMTHAIQALFMKSVSESIEKNANNPYLTSMNHDCDQRLAALSSLKPTLMTSPPISAEPQASYADVITADAAQKMILLDIFRTKVLPNKKKFDLNERDARFLDTEEEQCLFVLFNAYSKLSTEDQRRLSPSIEIATNLTYYHQIFSICGSMASRSPNLPKTMNTSFNLPELMQKICLSPTPGPQSKVIWTLMDPFIHAANDNISLDLATSKKPIQNPKIAEFLMRDMNHQRSEYSHGSARDPFSNSKIQLQSDLQPSNLTKKEFLFREFCHTRTAENCQITATLEFFQANPDLLHDPDWQTVATLNLLQPNVLLQTLEQNPALQNDIESFLTTLLTINSNNGRPNQVGLFCIRLQAMINGYLMDSQPPMRQQAMINLQKLYTSLEDMLQQPLDLSLQYELYQTQCHIIPSLIKQRPHLTDQQELLQSYLTAKLFGSTLNVLNLDKNPEEFIRQEVDMVAMKPFLVAHVDWVGEAALTHLQKNLKLLCKQDAPPPQLHYPNLFVTLDDEMKVAVNLETGQILKNGKEYCPLPPSLLASKTLQSLVGDEVNMGWMAMEKGTSVPALFEITKSPLFIKNTANGFIFQKNLSMPDGTEKRCQLTPLSELNALKPFLPKTLLDAQHRFWLTVDNPKQLIIEDINTKTMIYHMKLSATGTADGITALRDHSYQLLSPANVNASNINRILGNFEDPQCINVETYTGNDPANPALLISFPRYGLRFAVTSRQPLIIKSLTEPQGTLILDTNQQNQVGIKNILFIRTENKVVALLPRQYFIEGTTPHPKAGDYTPLGLDLQNNHPNCVLRGGKDEPDVYCQQSECVAVQLIAHDGGDTLYPEDSASALYLAYTYLANFDPSTALTILKECEQRGGLKGTQRELEHLMLFFQGLPAVVDPNKPVDNKIVDNPEFLAVRTFALYLYAERQNKDSPPLDDVTSTKQDAQCFQQDTATFQKNLVSTLDETFTTYFTSKHNVPVSMQLNAQQEATCLRMGSRSELLDTTYKSHQRTSFVAPNVPPTASANEQENPQITIQNGSTYAVTQRIKVSELSKQGHHKKEILDQITEPTRYYEQGNRWSSKARRFSKTSNFEAIFDTTVEKKTACDQLTLGLHPNNFFKHFLTYYSIASSSADRDRENKEKLNRFLTNKMHILAQGGTIPGAKFFCALYIISNDTSVQTKAENFLKKVAEQDTAYYLFDQSLLDADIDNILKQTTLEFEIKDARVPNETTLSLNQLATSQASPLVTIPPSDLDKLTYPVNKDILKDLNLSSLKELVKQVGSASLTKQLNDFKKLVSNHEALKQKNKKKAAKKLSTKPFVDAAEETLQIERELGEQHHADIQSEIEQATALFSNPLDSQHLRECMAGTAIRAKDCAETLRRNMLDYATACTQPSLDNPINLGQTAKFKPDLNEALLIRLYLEGSPQRFQELTGLNAEQTQVMYECIADYLYVSTYHKQLASIDSAFNDLDSIPLNTVERGLALRSLALKCVTPNKVKLNTDPPALTVFQFAAGTLLRPEQVVYLKQELEKTNGEYRNNLCQLIMGFGKTFLLPILAKAKANGDNLSVIEVPEGLFTTNLANFTQASMSIFNQKPHSFCFDSNTNCSSQELTKLYDRLSNIKNSRDYLVTTKKSVAFLNLQYIKMLNQLVDRNKQTMTAPTNQPDKALVELEKQVHLLGELVKLFRYKADAIIDEVHAELNIRKKLIYAVGVVPLAQEEINYVLRLYEFILPINTELNLTFQDIIQNPEKVPQTKWQAIMNTLTTQLMTHEESPIQAICKKIPTELHGLLMKYLQSNSSPSEKKKLFASLLKTEQDMLALYKTELTTLLPSTLSKQNRRHYGLLLKDAQIMNAPCAVPFIASDTPNIIQTKGEEIKTTNFANPDETLNYTIQAFLVQGLPKLMVKQIISSLREQAKIELMRDNTKNYATTTTGELFERITHAVSMQLGKDKQLTLGNPHLEDDNTFIEALMHSQPFIFYALEHTILPTIKVENTTLEMDSVQRAYSYHTSQGISGTLDNRHSLSQRMHSDSTQAIGTNGVTIGLIERKSTVNVIVDNNQPLVKTLFSNDTKETQIHAIIDAGGRFTGVTNFKVAQAIAAELREKGTKDPRKFVLFLNDLNELSAIDKDETDPNKVIFIGASDEKTIISKLGKHYTSDNWVTYFDQRHTVGMDIPQATQAAAAITVAYDGTLSAFLQAAMRMRGLPKEQTLQIYVDKSIASYCSANNVTPTPKDIIAFLSNNEMTYLSDDHLRYILAEMDNTLYQELLAYLLPKHEEKQPSVAEQAEMLRVIQQNGQIFLKKTVLELSDRYGQVETEGSLTTLLEQKKQDLIVLRKQILNSLKKDDASSKKFEDTLDECVKLAAKTCKSMVVSKNSREEGNQVEAETAVNMNTQMATEAAVAVENVSVNSNKTPTDYQEWLWEALQYRNDARALQQSYQKHSLSLPAMLETSTAYLPQLGLDPALEISNNQAKMYKEQVSLFDDTRMPFKYALMRWHAGTLSTTVITPHEVKALMQKQPKLFSTHGMMEGEQLWIESIPSGRRVAGQVPPKVTADFHYLVMKEQLLFMNGDLKSLLLQEHYVWLPQHLAIKKQLLSTLLISRPDQREYVEPLLRRLNKILVQDERKALEILADPKEKLDSREAYLFGIASLRCQPCTTLLEAQEKQCAAACLLLTRFSQSDLITSAYLSNVYPQLTKNQANQLAQLYDLKKWFVQRLSLNPDVQTQDDPQLNRLRNMLQDPPVELLRQLILQATAVADESLINACYCSQAHTTDILDGLPINHQHPILSSLEQRNYSLATTLLRNHFKTIPINTNDQPLWLEAAFQLAIEKNDMVAIKMLLENSGPTLALSQPLASDCIALLAQFQEPALTDTLLGKMKGTAYIDELQILNHTCQTLIETMVTMSGREEWSDSPLPSLQEEQYLTNYPEFTLQTGEHRGYSQLMLACHLGNLPITKKLLDKTNPEHHAEETVKTHMSALTAAIQSKSNQEVVSYLINQKSGDYYRKLSVENTTQLINKLRVPWAHNLDDKTLTQCLSSLIQYCPATFLEAGTQNSSLFRLFSQLVLAKKMDAAAVLYDYCQTNQQTFDRKSCVDLMISSLARNNEFTFLFLLNKFAIEPKDMEVFKMLLEKCGPLALSQSLASDCIVLFAQYQEHDLAYSLLDKMSRSPHHDDLDFLRKLKETCETLTNTMVRMSGHTEWDLSPLPSLQADQYLINYPEFTLQTGEHRGYSQLMLACHLGNLPITQQLLHKTDSAHHAEEVSDSRISALTAATQSQLGQAVASYLINERSKDFYQRLSLENTTQLIYDLTSRGVKFLDDNTLTQCLVSLTQYCPANILGAATQTETLFLLFSRLVKAKKTRAAAFLYDYCQSNQLIFDRNACVQLMISSLEAKNETASLFLLDKLSPIIMDESYPKQTINSGYQAPKIPFIIGYDNPDIRRACLSAYQHCGPKPTLSSEACIQIANNILRSLNTVPPMQYAANLQDAKELIDLLQNKQINTMIILYSDPVSEDLLGSLIAHCELNNMPIDTRKEHRSNLLLYTLEHGPQDICDALIQKGSRLSDKIGHTDQSALDVLISDDKWHNHPVVALDKMVELLNLEDPAHFDSRDYLKQASAHKNQYMIEALLHCRHAPKHAEQKKFKKNLREIRILRALPAAAKEEKSEGPTTSPSNDSTG